MSSQQTRPPRWMDRILELYCKGDVLEDLQGDLYEYYTCNLTKGRNKANLIYLLDVLKFCRPYTIKNPVNRFNMSFFNITGNYFKTSIRSLRRHKLFSIINIISLAISMSVGILMIADINELMTFDTFHAKKDRIFRVISKHQVVTKEHVTDVASTSVFLGKKLMDEYEGIENITLLRRSFKGDLKSGEKVVEVTGLYSTEQFFDIFTFKLIAGNPSTALLEPHSMVLTEKVAIKLFKDKNPIGETIISNDENYTITGVVEDVPKNSHMQYEVLTSFATLDLAERKKENNYFYAWNSIWQNYVYITLPEGQSKDNLQAQLDFIAEVENTKTDNYLITLSLENILEINPGPNHSNELASVTPWTDIYQLLGLTLIILLSACFNYTNLSIARSLRRAKEVGIRKVVGATKAQVFIQFVFEAILVAFISLFIAYGLFLVVRPAFIELILNNSRELIFKLEWIPWLVLFAIGIGILAGTLPALVLSKLKANAIFRDATSAKLMKGLNLRKVLIVFQFSLSMAFIIGATITYRQYKFATNFDLGYNTENILNIDIKGNDTDLLMAEFAKIPEVKKISRSAMVLSSGSILSDEFKYKDPMDSADLYINYVDSAYLTLHNFQFLAGGTFPYNTGDKEAKYVIIDEKTQKRFGMESPQAAIGETLHLKRREENHKLTIVGVLKNYQYSTIQSESEPTAFLQGEKETYRHINLIVKSDDLITLMGKLEMAWREVDEIHPFEAVFFDESIQEAYSDFQVMYKTFGFLAFLAVSIAAMGLLGMAVFTAETRIKEISVRKVLGANEGQLTLLLSKGFLTMLLVSAIIAIPASYALFEYVILEDYVNRIDIGALELLPGAVIIFAIGLITITWQTKKAANTNPAETLRND
ncbi:MAG: putative ABC transport system permease protein [Marinoscillum sp.]|jgi:putative ABC transport system permease protein